MFAKKDDSKKKFLQSARLDRKRREAERQQSIALAEQTKAANTVQRWWKRQQQQSRARQDCWTWWDEQCSEVSSMTILDLHQLVGIYCILRRRRTWTNDGHQSRLKQLVRYMTNTNKLADKQPYYVLLIDMRYMLQARKYLETLIGYCVQQCISSDDMSRSGPELTFLLQYLNPKTYRVKQPLDSANVIDISANILQSIGQSILRVTLCQFSLRDAQITCVEQIIKLENRLPYDTNRVNGLKLWLTTITRLTLYPIEHAELSSDALDMETASTFLWRNALAVPCLSSLINEMMAERLRRWTLSAALALVVNDSKLYKECAETLSGNGLLFLLGNLVDLWNSPKNMLRSEEEPKLVEWIHKLLAPLLLHFSDRQTPLFPTYHPLFKWSNATWGNSISSKVFDKVVLQLEYLWSRPFIDSILRDTLLFVKPNSDATAADGFKKLTLQRYKSNPGNLSYNLSLLAVELDTTFEMYLQLQQLLKPYRRVIIARIAFTPNLIPQLWRLMNHLGPKGNMQIYLDAAKKPDIDKEPLMQILRVFCEASSTVFLTLDYVDIFKHKYPFSPESLVQISKFLNLFYFTLLQQKTSLPTELPPAADLFKSARQLLLQIYELDLHQHFCPQDHWLLITMPTGLKSFLSSLIKVAETDSKNVASADNRNSTSTAAMFVKRLKEGDPVPLRILQLMPHTVPFPTRLKIFREWIELDKLMCPDRRIRHISVRRDRVLEDGYSALAGISAIDWKGTIRVSFVNELGLKEAGIDQGGPFKDFLTTMISEAFEPNYGLFTATQSKNFYPSPTSFVQGRNHIDLFEFIGKAIGKALYDGILIDVHFVGSLLAKLLGRNVFLNELEELDEELWKNLTYVKHYEGDVEDLGLSFEAVEDVLGEIKTHELKYNGKDTPVTNSNKIEYVYLMADYKLNQRSKEQMSAFIKGFKSIISEGWIKLFSSPELQRVLSGENTDIDLVDLRKHTEYENGYFDNHPIIRSFWQILSELSDAERKAFLKFTTGCPNPPLGGFEYLQPPFTIRLVSPDAATSERDGASLLKSFLKLNINKSGRLPSSSTW